MKVYNKIAMIVLMLSMSLGLFAQKGHGDLGGRDGRIMQELNLTDNQKSQVHDIMEVFRADMNALHQKEDITVGEQRDQMEELINERNQKIMGILDDTQKKKFQEEIDSRPSREEMAEKRKQMQEERDRLRTEMMSIKNDPTLTEEQRREKLRQFREQNAQNLKRERQYSPDQTRGPKLGDRQKAVPSNPRYNMMDELDLTPDQKMKVDQIQENYRLTINKIRNSGATQDAQRSQILEEADKMKTSISEVLTPEQNEKWQNMKPNKRQPRR